MECRLLPRCLEEMVGHLALIELERRERWPKILRVVDIHSVQTGVDSFRITWEIHFI